MLSREEVLKIARLARLELSDAEIELYRARLGKVLEHVRDLSSLATAEGDKAFVKHVPKDAVSFRADMPLPFANPKALMDNAPETEAGCFLLPTMVEHS